MSEHKKVEASAQQLAEHQKTYDHLFKMGKYGAILAIIITAIAMTAIIITL